MDGLLLCSGHGTSLTLTVFSATRLPPSFLPSFLSISRFCLLMGLGLLGGGGAGNHTEALFDMSEKVVVCSITSAITTVRHHYVFL